MERENTFITRWNEKKDATVGPNGNLVFLGVNKEEGGVRGGHLVWFQLTFSARYLPARCLNRERCSAGGGEGGAKLNQELQLLLLGCGIICRCRFDSAPGVNRVRTNLVPEVVWCRGFGSWFLH